MIDDIADAGAPESVAPGDAVAFARVYRAYLNPLCRFVYSYVKSWETAKDIVEEVFLQVWTRLHAIQPGGNLKAYLYTTARNQAIKHLRHEQVETRHRLAHHPAEVLGREPALPPEADERVASGELAAILQRAIDALPPRQREVILLKWERQVTHEEIAGILGISPKTVTEHFRRAVEYLRRVLPQDW